MTRDRITPSEIRLLPIEEVMARCAIGRTSLYAKIKNGDFPAPVRNGGSSRWLSTDVDNWIAGLAVSRTSTTPTRRLP